MLRRLPISWRQRLPQLSLRLLLLMLLLPLLPLLSGLLSRPAFAVTFGAPELESGLGERLRVVLPLTGPVKVPLTVDCIKLHASAAEPYDVSNLIRASLIQRGSGQVVVLTTAQAMTDVAVSFEAGIGCGIFFSRRYTLLLDPARELPSGAGTATTAPAGQVAEPATVPVPSAASVTAASLTAAPKPSRRLRLRGEGIGAPAAAGARLAVKPASVVRRVRPEDEPGVLPQSRTGTRKPLAPPVRSMLKIDIGGMNEFLADPSRSPLEQSTGMRLSGELGGNARPAAAAAADVEFKQAHARFLAALRDKPDPVAQENEALARRLDAVAKDIASLKVELQASAARAKELEAARVSWWWLLATAVLAAAAAAGLTLALRKPPPRQLILIDPDERSVRARASAVRATEPDESPGAVAITETYAMPDRPRPPEENQLAPESAAAAAKAKPAGSGNVIRYSAPIAAVRAAIKAPDDAALRGMPASAVAAPKPDKNSLTQQLSAVDALSDESWASYRPPADADGTALPFGAAAAPDSGRTAVNLVPIEVDGDASHGASIEINFDLDAEMAEYTKAATLSQPAAFEFDPAAAVAEAAAAAGAAEIPFSLSGDISYQTGLIDVPFDMPAGATAGAGAPAGHPGDLLNFDFDDPAADPDRTHVSPWRDPSVAMTYQTSQPPNDQALLTQVMMATASGVMEAAQRQWDEAGAPAAFKLLVPYLQLAPANTPPGPWVMLAHVLLHENLQAEYATVQNTFRERFGAPLPDWQTASTCAAQQAGLGRVPGLEIFVASQRGTAVLIERLAGLAYRVDAPAEVLFDLQFHRQVLLLAAECTLDNTQSGPDIDLAF